ncbi:MAG: WGR domain-containing protein [Nannocystaceae bacterium]
MKLLERVTLEHRKGSSDKVYIVEILELGARRYVVNFQYGRRGSTLKSGTKTATPVRESAARSIFSRLVDEKTRKGYTRVGSAGARASASAAAPSASFASREEALLARLHSRTRASLLARTVWRIGELKIEAAVPSLVGLLGSGSELLDYTITWALARCGDASTFGLLLDKHGLTASILDGELRAALNKIFPRAQGSRMNARVAFEALRAWGGALAAKVAEHAYSRLPTHLQQLVDAGPAEALTTALREHLEADTAAAYKALEHLYLLDTPNVRPALLAAVRAAPMRPPAFRTLRHLFKAAELRVDAELFGALAHRFATAPAMFRAPRWGDRVYLGRTYMRATAELQKGDSRLAYSSKTRAYLRRRVWRTLRRLGEAEDPDYVRLAVGCLLPFTDADAKAVQSRSHYDYRSRSRSSTHWDAYAGYQVFNQILYRHSPRYTLRPGTVAWRCSAGYKPGDPPPPVREEAFPKLWDQLPVGLVHLLAESGCARVHEFAVKALRANQAAVDALDVDILITLLGRPYEVTAAFAFDAAKARYQPQAPDLRLLGALADAAYEPARAQAFAWIDGARLAAMNDAPLIAGLLVARHPETRTFGRRFLESTRLSDRVAEAVIARTLAEILSKGTGIETGLLVVEAGDALLAGLARPLSRIGLDVIEDLVHHAGEAQQALGGRILLAHQRRADDLPQELIGALLRSRFAPVRGLGARLLGELSEAALSKREALLVDLILSRYTDLRDSIRPVVQRLASADPAFAADLSQLLIARLLGPESYEGLHSHILRVLRGELLPTLKAVPKDVVLRLLRAKAPQAQELGGLLLGENVDPAELAVAEVARLAGHEILAVREAAWKFFRNNVDRIRAELGQALRIVDAPWQDSREFAFDYFRSSFTGDDLTPDVLVGLCDSVRPDVQRFGQEMITRFFHEEQGYDYLLRLSQHPSADLQLFASNFLEGYAAGSQERLVGLKPYFLGVLSRVNQGRVAKDRVYAFLTAEALARRDAAEFIAELLIRLSLTIAVGDRATCIAALLEIHRAYPDLEVPLAVHRAPLRSRRPEVRDGV